MKKVDFNKGWTVQKESSDEEWKVNLPHDAMIYEKRSKNAPTTGACGYFYGGKYSYHKKWDVPEEWKSKMILMECEGVCRLAANMHGVFFILGFTSCHAKTVFEMVDCFSTFPLTLYVSFNSCVPRQCRDRPRGSFRDRYRTYGHRKNLYMELRIHKAVSFFDEYGSAGRRCFSP